MNKELDPLVQLVQYKQEKQKKKLRLILRYIVDYLVFCLCLYGLYFYGLYFFIKG